MPRCLASAFLLYAMSATAALADSIVMHAGEWETTIDKGKPMIVCRPADATLDQNYVLQSMSKIPGADCKMSELKTQGDVTSYSLQCMIGGSQMISSGSITMTGPDSYTGTAHSHGGMIKMPSGQAMAMPDVDMTSVSRRLGPCKPGDRVVGR
jgi:hypothetical protein